MINKLFRSSVLLLLAVVLSGCMGLFAKEDRVAPIWVADRVDLDDREAVKQVLYRQLKEWRSVPNRSGGLSKDGVDCSGFAYITFRTYFGILLPRSTPDQAMVGKEIGQDQLQPGDLVFYKTGVSQGHVGIYVEKRRFIHSSSTSGVMESHMDNPYWSKNYWKSVRVRL